MKSFLLDTCIWIDLFDPARPGGESARKLVDYTIDEDIELLFSASSIQNIEYVCYALLKEDVRRGGREIDGDVVTVMRSTVNGFVQHVLELASPVGLDNADIWLARKLEKVHPDFEDCLVLAAMERSGASCLVTNDESLIKHSPYPAMTPEDVLTFLA